MAKKKISKSSPEAETGQARLTGNTDAHETAISNALKAEVLNSSTMKSELQGPLDITGTPVFAWSEAPGMMLWNSVYPSLNNFYFDSSFQTSTPSLLRVSNTQRENDLESEIAALRRQLTEEQRKFSAERVQSAEKVSLLEKAQNTARQLEKRESLAFALHRIHPEAKAMFLESEAFQERLLADSGCQAFVLSVDIRRSTDLMLKARTPQLYAGFITTLAARMRDIVILNHGIFDKFTGDGILAFFPEFYSGEDAGMYALTAAVQCHQAFREIYDASRHCFHTVPTEIGLGIGIDYGEVSLVRIGDGLTVVGTPVVYACRMAGAPARTTLMNQPAFERMSEGYSAYCVFEETSFGAKHEGAHLAYSVRRNPKPYSFSSAGWLSFGRRDTEAPKSTTEPTDQKKTKSTSPKP